MLKQLFVCCLLITAMTTNAFAVNYQGKINYNSRKNYKGEFAPPPAAKTTPPPTADFTPCATYTIVPGPYLGLNPGFRTNYNKTASVYKAFEGTVFAGYAMLNANFYLAAEIFAQHGVELQNYRNNVNANLNIIGLKTTWGAGLSVLPGLVLADTLLGYLRLGAVETHFQDAGQTAAGGQVGIGLESTVSESWAVRAEYSYLFYQSVTGLGSPRSDTFIIGVLYKFWS